MKRYTTNEAAEIAQIHPASICAAIAAARLKAEKRGRNWLIAESSLQDFLKSPRKPRNGQEKVIRRVQIALNKTTLDIINNKAKAAGIDRSKFFVRAALLADMPSIEFARKSGRKPKHKTGVAQTA
jgi:hypothetical protein